MDIKKEDLDIFERLGNWMYGIVAGILGAMWTVIKYFLSQKGKVLEERFKIIEKKIEDSQKSTDGQIEYIRDYLSGEKAQSEEYKLQRIEIEEKRQKEDREQYESLMQEIGKISITLNTLTIKREYTDALLHETGKALVETNKVFDGTTVKVNQIISFIHGRDGVNII